MNQGYAPSELDRMAKKANDKKAGTSLIWRITQLGQIGDAWSLVLVPEVSLSLREQP
jgi:hypothetical protein